MVNRVVHPFLALLDFLKRHLYVLGMSGTGKSRGMADWAVKIIQKDIGIAVIDPHDTFYSLLVDHAAVHGARVWDKIILLDPVDVDYAIGFNPLELLPGEVPQRKAKFLANVISKIYHADPLVTARMNWLMTNAFWLLIESELTLAEFQMILTNARLREILLDRFPEHHGLRIYWENEFPKNERLITEWTQSSLNRIGSMLLDPDIKLMFGQKRSTINFANVMDTGKILLVSLAKGIIGRQDSYLVGAFLMAQIQMAALARADQMHRQPRQFALLVDEFQNYLTDDIDEILSESRKYNLSLIMAHQYFDQLAEIPTLKSAVLGTTGNFISFRIGRPDAEEHAKNVFTPPIDQLKDIHRRAIPTGFDLWPYHYVDDAVWRPLEEIWEVEIRKMTELQDRFFWFKQKGRSGTHLIRTHNFPDIPKSTRLKELRSGLIRHSTSNYGRLKREVRSEINARQIELLNRLVQPTEEQQPESY